MTVMPLIEGRLQKKGLAALKLGDAAGVRILLVILLILRSMFAPRVERVRRQERRAFGS
jgi:hypothetical protein